MSNLTPNNGWISVNDHLPDSPRQVLIYTDFGGRYVGCYNGDAWFSYGFNNCQIYLRRRLINGTIF